MDRERKGDSGDKGLIISTLLFILLILVGVVQSITGFVIAGGSSSGQVSFGKYVSKFIFPRFWQIISSPFSNPEMLWIAFPLLVVLLFMQIYFGRWRNEKLGWSSAFANWISLLFVGVNLFKEMIVVYGSSPSVPIEIVYKFLLIFLLFVMSTSFLIILFLHAIPKRASFIVSSPLTIYTFAFIMIALVYSNIPLDLPTFISALLVYIFVLLIFKGIQSLVPPSIEAKRYLEDKALIEKKIRSSLKAVRTRRRHIREKKIKSLFQKTLRFKS